MQSLLRFIGQRKRAALAIVILVIIVVYGWNVFLGDDTEQPRYVTAAVEKGTLVASVSGSGQVSAENQIDVKSDGQGKVLSVRVTNGQEVETGDVLVQLDDQDARRAVRDADNSLKSAQIALEKIKQPADEYEILQAENAVTKAKNDVEKMRNPDEATLLQAQNTLQKAKDDLEKLKLSQSASAQNARQDEAKATDDIQKAYDDALTTASDALVTFPTTLGALDEILYDNTIDGATENVSALLNTVEESDKERMRMLRTTTETDYRDAMKKSDATRVTFDASSRNADATKREALLDETIATARAVAQATQSARNYLDTWVDLRTQDKLSVFPKVTEYEDDLAGYITTANARLTALLNAKQDLTDNRTTLENAKRDLSNLSVNGPRDLAAAEATVREKEIELLKLAKPDSLDLAAAELLVTEKQAALEKLRQGADPLDVRSQELTVEQRANTLSDAREKLSNAAVKALFDGVVAKVSVNKGDTITANTAVATLVTSGRIAQVSLNEVDIAKVRVRQKATLTFDAVDDLTITGQVVEADTLGTVTQGVVTYGVKILFDTTDERIRPGMSVSASIVTDSKVDVLLVPNAAVKSVDDTHYVEMPDEKISETLSPTGVVLTKLPRQQQVQTGTSNDTSTEILEGLVENDIVIVRTITNSTTTPTSGQNIFQFGAGNRAGGGTGGGAGNIRIPIR